MSSSKCICELCGLELKGRNKLFFKQEHLENEHFKEKLERILPKTQPFKCPSTTCIFVGTDKEEIRTHCNTKHEILKIFLFEELKQRGLVMQNAPKSNNWNLDTKVDTKEGDSDSDEDIPFRSKNISTKIQGDYVSMDPLVIN